jgi:hypothetical protein
MQRRGRVGRTAPGTVYHLYSEKDYNEKFAAQPTPPMQANDVTEDLFSLAASDEHRGDWTGALAHAKSLLSRPTPEQLAITQMKLEFYRCIGPTARGGADGDAGASSSGGFRMGPVGYTLHDISRVFRTSFDNSLLILAGRLYGSIYQILKVVAIMEETGGDLNSLWKTDNKGVPISVMDDPRVADNRSDHITLVNIFDSLGFLDTDYRMAPKIQDRYNSMVSSNQRFTVNFPDSVIFENFPWCVGNRELTDPKEQFAVAVMVARMFCACKVVDIKNDKKNKKSTAKNAKSLYIPKLTVAVDLKGVEVGDVIVCENFSSNAGKNTATVATAFLANVKLQC